ncbi:hypothetical protein Tco_1127342 [Tanacetum coccineum]
MSEIIELHDVDRKRQAVTSEMLKADYRRSAEMRELRTTNHTRHHQLIQTLTVMQSLQREVIILGQQCFSGDQHRYAVSSLMDTAYGMSKQNL